MVKGQCERPCPAAFRQRAAGVASKEGDLEQTAVDLGKAEYPAIQLCAVSEAALHRIVALASWPTLQERVFDEWQAEAEPLRAGVLLNARAAGPVVLGRVLLVLDRLEAAMRETFRRWGCGVIELVKMGGPKPLDVRAWALEAIQQLRRLVPLLIPLPSEAMPEPGRAARPRPRALTCKQEEVWDLLEGRILMATDIAKLLRGRATQEHAIRKLIEEINKRGWEIRNEPGVGYYRPDAPPPI